MDCASDRYWSTSVYAGLMVMAYPLGCPTVLLFMLFRHRERLDPPGVPEEVTIKSR